MPDLKLRKKEVLRSKAEIDELFSGGHGGRSGPIRYVKTTAHAGPEDSATVKVLFAAPKKNLRRAWMRNTVKRRMREAYRLNKHLLAEKAGTADKGVRIALIYSSADIAEYGTIENAVKKILGKIAESL